MNLTTKITAAFVFSASIVAPAFAQDVTHNGMVNRSPPYASRHFRGTYNYRNSYNMAPGDYYAEPYVNGHAVES